jgi:hypothetical protein
MAAKDNTGIAAAAVVGGSASINSSVTSPSPVGSEWYSVRYVRPSSNLCE